MVTIQNKFKHAIDFVDIKTKNEFVQAEYAYIRERYGAYGVGYKGVIFWLKPFTYNMAEIELMDGTKEVITFKIPNGYFAMPEGEDKEIAI